MHIRQLRYRAAALGFHRARMLTGIASLLALGGCAGPLTIGGECTSMGFPQKSPGRAQCLQDRRVASNAAMDQAQRNVLDLAGAVAAAAVTSAASYPQTYSPPVIVQQYPQSAPARPVTKLAPSARPMTMCPDGTYVAGNCRLAPNGKYVGD